MPTAVLQLNWLLCEIVASLEFGNEYDGWLRKPVANYDTFG